MRDSTKLREYIDGDQVLVIPGVYDGLSARLVERAGSQVVYASGGAIARSSGIPDMGLLGLPEVVARLEQIVDSVTLPVIADCDTGYGNALNAQRAIRAFERAGVAGLHLEDQTFPKRCGHLDDKGVVPTGEFAQKIRAARDASQDPDLVIIARTDALAVEGLESALERMHAYMEAGADVAFVEAPVSEEQIREIAERLPYPKLINMFDGGKTPMVPLDTLSRLGYRLVLVPSDLQRAAIKAMDEVARVIRRDGNSAAVAESLISFEDRERIIDTPAYLELSRRFGA
jgi:2-methylisocitrate lyase-like PEP mutase family enzyme